MPAPVLVEAYLAGFPAEAQTVLRGLRAAILRGDPDAVEAIRYRMPAFRLGGRTWLHLGGWTRHAGLYPVPRYDDLEDRVTRYRTTRSTVALPYADSVPYDLVEQLAARIAVPG